MNVRMLPYDPMEVVAHAIASVFFRVFLFFAACWIGYVAGIACLWAQAGGGAVEGSMWSDGGWPRWLGMIPIEWAAGVVFGFMNPVLWVYVLVYPAGFFQMVWGETSRVLVFAWMVILEAAHTYLRIGPFGWGGIVLVVAGGLALLAVNGIGRWLGRRELARLEAMEAELEARIARAEAEDRIPGMGRGSRAGDGRPAGRGGGPGVDGRGSFRR